MTKKVDSFANRLNQLLTEYNMSKADLSRRTGFRTSSISDWTNGLYDAKQDKVDVLSRVFHVNPAYLMGYDVEKNNQEKIPSNSLKDPFSYFSKDEKKLLKNFNGTTAIGKQRILTTSEEMVKLYPIASTSNTDPVKEERPEEEALRPSREEMLDWLKNNIRTAAFGGGNYEDITDDEELYQYYQDVRSEFDEE